MQVAASDSTPVACRSRDDKWSRACVVCCPPQLRSACVEIAPSCASHRARTALRVRETNISRARAPHRPAARGSGGRFAAFITRIYHTNSNSGLVRSLTLCDTSSLMADFCSTPISGTGKRWKTASNKHILALVTPQATRTVPSAKICFASSISSPFPTWARHKGPLFNVHERTTHTHTTSQWGLASLTQRLRARGFLGCASSATLPSAAARLV